MTKKKSLITLTPDPPVASSWYIRSLSTAVYKATKSPENDEWNTLKIIVKIINIVAAHNLIFRLYLFYVLIVRQWPHDTQHKDIRFSDIQHYATQHNGIQHNNEWNATLSITTLRIMVLVLIVMLSVVYAMSKTIPFYWMSFCQVSRRQDNCLPLREIGIVHRYPNVYPNDWH